jgi:hypothetical protein
MILRFSFFLLHISITPPFPTQKLDSTRLESGRLYMCELFTPTLVSIPPLGHLLSFVL